VIVGLAVRPQEWVCFRRQREASTNADSLVDMETPNSRWDSTARGSAGMVDWDISGAHNGTTGLGEGGDRRLEEGGAISVL
jgi:hypothetical protein